MNKKHRVWIGYGAERQGDLVLESRYGEMLVEREVPLLPTAPYTVIRVHWRGVDPEWGDVMILRWDGRRWSYLSGGSIDPQSLAERISGFEVLAEPCGSHYGAEDLKQTERDTAKAVLDRVLDFIAVIAREFEVES